MTEHLTFQEWKKEVERLLTIRLGLLSNEVPDYWWEDEYEAGAEPDEAADEYAATRW